MRLDKAIVKLKIAESRAKAQFYIKMKAIKVNNQIITKSSYQIGADDVIELTENPCVYVSRAGLKLEKAINTFGLNFKDKTVLDLGASTGGFSDCALQHGAKKVYAVDVGHNQLHQKLRQSEKIVSYEGLNLKDLTGVLDQPFDLVTVDVSFISLAHVFKTLKNLVRPDTSVIALIKPQFEVGVKGTTKGVVKHPETHIKILRKVIDNADSEGFKIMALTYAPYKADAGNIEFLAHFIFTNNQLYNNIDIRKIVVEAHNTL